MDNDNDHRTTSYRSRVIKTRWLKHRLSRVSALVVSIWLVVVIAIVFWIIGSGDSPSGELSEKKPRDLPEVVQLSLGKTQLYIPSKYLKGQKVGKNHLGWTIHINLWALLPDFDWYEPSRNHFEFVEQRIKGRRVQIRLRDREGMLPLPEFFKEHPSYQKYTYFSEGRHDGLKYGLEFYNNHDPRWEWYFLRNEKGEPVLQGTCNKDEVVPYPGCELMWELSPDVRVRVDFDKRYLANWRPIYSQVNRLVSPNPQFGDVSSSKIKGN